MTYYLIAGEASGDLHASNLMKALKQEDAAANFRCWGGDLMQAAGGDLVKHYRELAFMGFWEVIKNLRTITKNLDFCKTDIAKFRPDVLILIDYSGFNLRIAKWAKTAGFKVFYYISPQIWASRQSRVHDIKKWVDRMFVILPFEKDFYQQFDVQVDFVGHPLLDAIADFQENVAQTVVYKDDSKELQTKVFRAIGTSCATEKPIIALLPGSRKQEIGMVLKIMLSVVKEFMDYQFVVAVAPSIPIDYYQSIFKEADISEKKVLLISNQTYGLLNQAKAAIVTSGTATLETALFEVPQVVCYKGSWLTYQVAKRIIKIPYISLVNLITNRPVVKELLQNELTKEHLKTELTIILTKEKRTELISEYREIKTQLGNAGASKRAARLMVQYLKISK